MGQSEKPGPTPNRVLAFSLENLRAVLPTPQMPAHECPICLAINEGGAKLEKGGTLEYDTIPTAVQQLTYFMELGEHVKTNWLDICPSCQRLYYCELSYEFLIGGSEDYESYVPITPEAVLKLAEVSWVNATGRGEIRAYENGTWGLVRDRNN